jgi:hypothetical protein
LPQQQQQAYKFLPAYGRYKKLANQQYSEQIRRNNNKAKSRPVFARILTHLRNYICFQLGVMQSWINRKANQIVP